LQRRLRAWTIVTWSSPSDKRLRAYLSGLSREELVARLLALAERDEVALTALRAEEAAASGKFDLAAFRKELTARIRISGFVDWLGAAGYAQRVHGLLDVLEALLAAGRADDVVVLAEHVMARLDTALGRIDDSNGHLGGVLDRVSDLHLSACDAARPEPKRLAVRLVEFALKSNWEWFLDAPQRYADVLGEEGLAAYRARLEREWEALPALPPTESRVFGFHDARRFTVTRLRESLARAGGNVDELVSVLAKDLSTPYRFCEIAEELEQAGREREALVWLERGLHSFPPAADERLRSRLIRAYVRDGQAEDAVALAERAFTSEPRASTYLDLRETASGLPDWAERRSAALQRLRDPAAEAPPASRYFHRDRSEVVRAQLEEGDLEAAWADAVEGGCEIRLWRQLADARRERHPDESIGVYRRLLDKVLEQTDVRAYHEAVALLREIRKTLTDHAREEEFADDVERIREAHRRRPKLLSQRIASS
jgi:tetratricopeptide (TPR) repeat protein